MRRSLKSLLFDEDIADLLFRLFFCSIFLILGCEHLFRDDLIRRLMPDWFIFKRALSMLAGAVMLGGAALVVLGYKSRLGACVLAAFLIAVTLLVHVPALAGFGLPPGLPAEWHWLWVILQRSNFVKNLCLLGVCAHLMHHKPGKYSVERWLASRR